MTIITRYKQKKLRVENNVNEPHKIWIKQPCSSMEAIIYPYIKYIFTPLKMRESGIFYNNNSDIYPR